MKRRVYQEPAMIIVEVRQRYSILAGSNSSAANMNATYSEEDWSNE